MKKNERLTLNSDLLRTFVVIAECGNLTHAADQLHRTQSAVSVKLRRLEEDLKVSLFERHARGMTLSQNGEKLLPIARRALAEIHRAGTLFDAPLRGSIRVGIPDDFDDRIGHAIACRLVAEGAAVTATGTRADGTSPEGCVYRAIDFTDPAATAAFADSLAADSPDFIELDEHGYVDKVKVYQELGAEFEIPLTAEELAADFRLNSGKYCNPLPFAIEVLEHLRSRGYKLCIITNGHGESQRAKLIELRRAN